MDEPGLDPVLLESAYRDLSRFALFSRTVIQVARPVFRFARSTPRHGALRLLDLGTGGGDLAIGLARRLRAGGIQAEIHAADRNPRSLARATARAMEADVRLQVHAYDAERDSLPARPDVVVSSLFLHHLTDDGLEALFRAIHDSSAQLAVMNDLRRSRTGLIVASCVVRLTTRNPVVRADAPQSVRAALRPAELRDLAARTGLGPVTVGRCFPWRQQLHWVRQ